MIEIWTVSYRSHDASDETISVYAYPSGGVGITGTDPGLVVSLGGTRELVGGISPDESVTVAQRLTDMVRHLTGGDIESYRQLDTTDV